MPRVELAIIELTNRFRAEHALAQVVRDAKLDAAARYFARFLARTGKFAHEADGRAPADRARAHGYKFCQIAENLALHLDSRGFHTRQLAAKAVTGWINSPGHRRNMLRAHVTQIGVGVAKAPFQPKYISVQLFGLPMSARYGYNVFNYSDFKVAYSDGSKTYHVAPREMATHEVCLPVTVRFRSAKGKNRRAHGLKERYRAKHNDVFTLRNTNRGGVSIIRSTKIQ